MIIEQLNAQQAITEFHKYGRFSLSACTALIHHLAITAFLNDENNVDFNPIAQTIQWREYKSLSSAYEDLAWLYGGNLSGGIDEETAREWFNSRTTIIEFDGGVLVNMNF